MNGRSALQNDGDYEKRDDHYSLLLTEVAMHLCRDAAVGGRQHRIEPNQSNEDPCFH
jgi:hypothetical protein